MASELSRKIRAMHGAAVNRLIEDLSVGTTFEKTGGVWRPPTDVFECNTAFVIRMEISGLRRTDDGFVEGVEIVINDDMLLIRGNRKEHCPHEKFNFYQMEIHYGPFECRIRLHAPFDRDNIRAQYTEGFLEVVIPKAVRGHSGVHRITVR